MKIIIFMKNWVGDAFFQFPAIRLIREHYPEAKITCIAPPRCRELLAANPDISEVLEFDEKSTHRSWLDRAMFAVKLRAQGPWAEGYLFHRSKSRAMLLALAGVKKRFGYGKGRSFWLTQAVDEPAPDLHHVEYFLELLRGCHYEIPERPCYELPVNAASLKQADKLLESLNIQGRSRFVCFHLGANWEPKRWPAEHFAVLADLIHDAWNIPVVVTGSGNDQFLFDAMRPSIKRAQVFSLIGQTTLDVLATLYSRAVFVVSGDSGPMHVAAAVGTPLVGLFGPTNPALTGPRGKGDAAVLSFVPEGFSSPYFGAAANATAWLEKILPHEVFETIQKKGWMR